MRYIKRIALLLIFIFFVQFNMEPETKVSVPYLKGAENLFSGSVQAREIDGRFEVREKLELNEKIKARSGAEIVLFEQPLQAKSGDLEIKNSFEMQGNRFWPSSLVFAKSYDTQGLDVIEITSEAVLHLPKDMDVIAVKPKIYRKDEFSEEIWHYLVFVGIFYTSAFVLFRGKR